MAAFDSTQIARLATGLYAVQIGNTTMQWALDSVNGNAYGSVGALANALYTRDFGTMTNAAVASLVVANVGITSAAQVAEATSIVTSALNAAAAGKKGETILGLLNGLATLATPSYAGVVSAYNTQVALAESYAKTAGTKDVSLASLTPVFNLDDSSTIAGFSAMHLTGNQDVRIDFTNPANQVKGLDLNGDGVIAADGVENRVTGVASNFKAVDAYPRNPWNQKDTANNFTGDIYFDGTGFKGDGVSTNGNIFLGGFGADTALGGVGNDFLAGGGTTQGTTGVDSLSGGRNADFFFAELSALDPTDGNKVAIDGGVTADDNSAGVGQSAQDADWLLFEGSDDDEPVTVVLRDDSVFDPSFATPNNQGVTGGIYTAETGAGVLDTIDRTGYIITRAGAMVGTLRDIENFDASGNLYGFLNGLDVELGGRATDDRDAAGSSNYGIGSSAQLRIVGSNVANVIIGGYDNDYIQGADGNDLLMGGNLKQYAETVTGGVTNVNLAGIVNDGRDELYGGGGNDNIVFEADGGVIAGDAEGTRITAGGPGGNDTLWLTKYSTGLQAASDLTTDGVLRFDLTSVNSFVETSSGEGGSGYGGANVTGTADQTNYKTATAPAFSSRVTVTGMDNIDATGLGAIDYYAAGANRPDAVFANHQNFAGYNGNLNLRGDQSANNIYSGEGDDIIEGRAGNDDLEGNKGKDDFYFAIDGDFGNFAGTASGDGIDKIRRKIDANGDGFWDESPASTNTQNPSNGTAVWGQDFGLDSDSTTGASVLTIDIQKSGGNTAGTELNAVVNFVSEIVTGVKVGSAFETITLNTAAIKAATTYAGLTAAINTALDATSFGADLQATLSSNGHTITISDAKGRELADQTSEVAGAGVSVNQIANTSTQNTFVFGAPAVTTVQDRLIYKAYEDRSDNEGVDDDSVLGSTISLGNDAYAQDLVISFQKDSSSTFGTGTTTYLAEDQRYTITFDNLTTQDRVTVAVNGVKYTLQVGLALDGTIQANEDTVTGVSQPRIQANFVNRLAQFIDLSFTDDDTVAGKVVASASSTLTVTYSNGRVETTVISTTTGGVTTVGATTDNGIALGAATVTASTSVDTLTLTQQAYQGEETVFMRTPTVSIDQLSGGQTATATVANAAQHEVMLYQFDGRNAKLNTDNVKFWGGEEIQRSVLATAKTTGGSLSGLDAVLIDGGTNTLQATVANSTSLIDATQNTIFDNVATNANLAVDFAVHGDDFLLGGDGVDVIKGGTGDDRVIGSIGSTTAPGLSGTDGERLDGGKNYYAVKLLDEAQARVYVLNAWERGAANIVSVLPELSGKVITSITLIDQTQTGATPTVGSGVFSDTLQYQQEDFSDAKSARFTITLDDYSVAGGVVSLKNDGAGLVSIDANGDGVFESYARFTNFENIRTVSGWGAANASEGQGNDTLNVVTLSKDTGGISYDLTNGANAGQVRYSADAHSAPAASAAAATAAQLALAALRPTDTDFEALVLRVDGVESVIAGDGDDLVLIDETEAAKNNSFTGGLGDDRIEYQNDFGGGGLTADQAEPKVTITVNTAADTDTVVMTGGRIGTVVATDTLSSVEFITLAGNTAEGTAEADVLNVANVTNATVDYSDSVQSSSTTGTGVNFSGTVRNASGGIELTVEQLYEVENVVTGTGNDTVKVADADVMSLNTREDGANATAAADITFATFIDFDAPLTTAAKRTPFLSQTSAQIEDVRNNGEFTFNLGAGGGDTVDYSNAVDNISVVVELDETKENQYVLVDSDGATFFDAAGDMAETGDRIDVLKGAERIVAAQGESVLDLTSSTKGLEIKFAAFDVANQTASLDRDSYSVRISDLTSASPLQRSYVEYRDAGLSSTINQAKATWSRIEGSDNAEVVILNSAHSADTNAFNLRGGANQVKYNELTKSIELTLSVTDWNATTQTGGTVNGTVKFYDGNGNAAGNLTAGPGGTHTISSYTANNGIAAGSLRVAASQDAEDTLAFTGLTEKLFLLSEAGTTDNQITVKIGSGAAQNSVILTGFEFVRDSSSNDIYDFGSIVNASIGLDFVDTAGDHDTVKVDNGAKAFNGAGATEISLPAINASTALAPAGFDFDVLDVTKVTDTAVTTLTGVTGGEGTDEVVIGAINNITSALQFESVVFTQATVTENGTTFVLNTGTNSVTAGSKTITLTNGANTLSFGGTVLEQSAAPSHLRAATDLNTTGNLTVTITGTEAVNITGGNGNDSITGGAGADTLRGNLGTDTLDGSFVPEAREVHTYVLSDPTGGAGETLTLNGFTVTEGATIRGVVVANNDADAIGAAFVREWAANPTSFTANASLASITYDALTNALTFTFTSAAGDVSNTILGAPAGTAAASASAETVTTAYAARAESSDTYVFEATATTNGLDTINNFNATGAGTDDVLDFRAFLGTATTTAGAVTAATNFVTTGLDLSAAGNNYGVVFNKATLAASDIQQTAAAGKIAVELNSKAVVIATGDANGAPDGTNDGYGVFYVTVGATAAETTVTKVATINSASELSAISFQGITGVTATTGDDVLAGNDAANTIDGLAGNDTITGGAGNDTLTGGLGTDTFIFSGVTTLSNGADTITDFNLTDDTMSFSLAAVNAASGLGLAAGAIPAANIVIGAGAVAGDANDIFTYNTTNGQLSFDADGNGAGAPVLLATLTGFPVITTADVVLG